MEYINPIFNEQRIIKTAEVPKGKNRKTTKRKQRSDKTHNIKFPITTVEKMRLQSLCKQAKRLLSEKGIEPIPQTKLNTLLLEYGLRNQELISWERTYENSRYYMHTNILESIYQLEIGSPYALAVQKGMSDRKVVYMIIMSVLNWIEGEGSIEEILQLVKRP